MLEPIDQRVRRLNDAPPAAHGQYVLYWCRSNRRAESNHALAFAAGLANERNLPLLFFESLPCTYPHASGRLHTFALEGVPETAARLRRLGIGYVFHLPRRRNEPDHAIDALTAQAAAVVTDDWPLATVDRNFSCYAAAVDSSCIVPQSCVPQRVYAAYSMRPKIRRLLPRFLTPAPPVRVRHRFRATVDTLHTEVDANLIPGLVASCEIDRSVPPSICFRGGRSQAKRRLQAFLRSRLRRYAGEKNQPAAHATSDLSPYLHWGYLSSLEVALAVRDYAAGHKLIAEEFLEELIVRRELAFNFARYSPRVDSLEELPEWARSTLHRHARDRRGPVYSREQFETAATCDDLWDATQKELLLRGKIHGYYRMYWGKKIVEWSATPEEALATMIHLNDRYALDGQDPNGYANILWCFGLHDRPWPERPVFGTIRSMSRAGMERKTDVAAYIREIAALAREGTP